MSNREEFEKWQKDNEFMFRDQDCAWDTWKICAELKDKEIERQNKMRVEAYKNAAESAVIASALHEENEKLRAELDSALAQLASYKDILVEASAAIDELDALKSQEPVGYWHYIDGEIFRTYPENIGAFPLYTRPVPAIGSQTIPEGMVIVPVEPTDEMIAVACDITDAYRVEMVRAYEAMIAAAQKGGE